MCASYFESFEDEQVKLIDPKRLKSILEKVLTYLKNEEQNLPFEVCIDYYKMKNLGLETDLYVDGARCWIQGDSEIFKVGNEVKLVNFPLEKNIEKWIKVQEQVRINDRLYYFKIETRYERHKESITKCIDYCIQAIEKEKQIYWLYQH